MIQMKMTETLANNLMELLACVAISAHGGIYQHEDGHYDQKQIESAEQYARETFCQILGAWEELTGEKWEIGD